MSLLPFSGVNPFYPLVIVAAAIVIGFFVYLIGYLQGREHEAYKQGRSKKFSRSILGGMFSEQVAPFLSGFPKDLKASEARFIGKPIDFLIFKGMDEQNIEEVVFVEVKTGQSQLSSNERKLRDVVNNKKVRWVEYRVDGEITKIPVEPVQVSQ